MKLYQIPDIRLFWSRDSGFTRQFDTDYFHENIVYKVQRSYWKSKLPTLVILSITFQSISKFPQCINSLSFWLPEVGEYSENDFYDLVRSVGGDQVEQVTLVDDFTHPKTKRRSHCFELVISDSE